MQRLKAILTLDGSSTVGYPTPVPVKTYALRFQAFYCSAQIAQSDEEIAFVRDRYCPMLHELYGGLSDGQRTEVAREVIHCQSDSLVAWAPDQVRVPVDEQNVRGFCRSPAG